MYYLPFDRLMGLWIINEFLKSDFKILFRLRWLEVVSLLTFLSAVIFPYLRILPWISKPY